MASFSASTHAEAVVDAPQRDIWDALVDPDLVARFTPFLDSITADGAHWLWQMGGLEVAGLKIKPSFTELMVFDEPDRIEFRHDPPGGVAEKAGVEGWYSLASAPGGSGTLLVTELEITLSLPLPRATGPVVRRTMSKVVEAMGDRFSKNLLDHLGAHQR